MSDRFDLEESLQRVWATTEDIDLVISQMTTDKDKEYLTLLRELLDLRCQKAWNIFEKCIKNKVI
jgi:hypothetical protein